MPEKVKRGIGLVVVAVIAWAIGLTLTQSGGDGPLVTAALLATGLVGVVGFFGGLALVAWGLLRD